MLKKNKVQTHKNISTNNRRDSLQPLLQQNVDRKSAIDLYDPAPFYSLGSEKIFTGFNGLIDWIIQQKTILIDGYGGIFFEDVQQQIQNELEARQLTIKWHFMEDYFKPEVEIEKLVRPFLGGVNDVWGTRTDLELKDFFNSAEISTIEIDDTKDLNIVIGTGAGLISWDAPVIYFEIPKNEIQYRMRAGSLHNLGIHNQDSLINMYKRLYFVDWVVLNQHRQSILNKIVIVADGQWLNNISWIFKKDLMEGLSNLSHSVLRARPWFESGSWGGQWMKEHLKGLNKEEVNYAWSFELITPENGVVLESDGKLLEIPFDFLMLLEYKAILGKHAGLFGSYFPIRFDFLDTFNGGNLSIQCHPSRSYIKKEFGEIITQDETYYILDCEPGAKVYLGFQDDIDPVAFREELENSQSKNQKIVIEKYVQSFPSRKHELFLIPNGTVHSSGINNMVLEISATPYIFTFKMYDWLSLDLKGEPRPINIEHAFNNLRFERKGSRVTEELISQQTLIEEGSDWRTVHLPTHKEHFYDIERIEFDSDIIINTEDRCHVLMLVEGSVISVAVNDKESYSFNYAETFIVPAATKQYKLTNHGKNRAKVIKAFLKHDIQL
uniref:class I mannose-6-phosphate isomerase n=1 Tax=Pedobacter schmidteae TaxID=2201271 RepID=UPI000EABCC09|nr:class I mannose-6-phosphate isomerase [Pedobacter schmidteae]